MTERIVSKTCRVCKRTKALSEFCKDATRRDKLSNKCRSCCSEYEKGYRQTKRGKTAKRYYQKHYKQGKKGKAAAKRYDQSKKGRIARRNAQRRYGQTKKGRKTHADSMKRFNLCHPERSKAYSAVQRAIRSGKLPRSDALQCNYCPGQARQYHHWHGYAPKHWLDVVPICRKCHPKV